MKKETRIFDSTMEVRSDGDNPKLVGTAAVFNSDSEKLGGWFIERIAPGAFDDVLEDDVRALFNHDPNFILGRTKAGTLSLRVTDEGLTYTVDLPDTTAARDLAKSIERGDVSQSSFAFQVGKDRWEMDGEDEIRVIERVNRLYDVSPVTYPAYPDTAVAKRSMEAWKEDQAPQPPEPDFTEIRNKIRKQIINSAKAAESINKQTTEK
jgi:HK97 family phage prohead protease